MQQELPVPPPVFRVHHGRRRGGVPHVDLMGRELIMPFQFSCARIERENALGEQVVAGPVPAVGVGVRGGSGPEKRVGLRVVAASQPGCAASELGVFPLPGFVAWFLLARNGPESPRTLAGGSLVSSQKSANPPIGAGDARHNHVFHHQRRHRRAIVLRLIRHHDFPDQSARCAIQRDQMGIVRGHENLVAEDRCAAICT